MGICLSARVKAESPAHPGLNSQYVSSGSNNMSTDCSKNSTSSVPPTPRTEGEILQSPNLKSFNFSDLKVATRNFRPDSVLGGGGFGSVFKGWIDENSFTATKPGTGMVIAVKKLHQESVQGHREWLGVRHLTTKSDVYSYGVVLLELLSGRRAIDKNRPSGEHNLVEWCRPFLPNKRKVFRIMDNRLEGQYSMEVAQKVANLALRCISLEPKLRPNMQDVVKELEQIKDSTKSTDSNASKSRDGSRQRRRSAGDVIPSNKVAHTAYPRPSASPLHSK
ncbi:hypothetical protein SASPL_120185 [Salvia splendens]|uniref:Protein kinase domain-containing protein n=1 Tax=Salvia splendens TaxID=180675 RepID=A0A8X8ZV13_SALSN|nr:hypothetical protein SASPL_120185 [Salvia splendens]